MAKEEAAAYLESSEVSKIIEEAVNELLKTKPDDCYGELSQIFKAKAKQPVIDHLIGREVLDSRGNPTVEVDVYAKYLGTVVLAGRSSAPSGASTGSGEAMELRDKDPARYNGKGTLTASGNVASKISPALQGKSFTSLKELDDAICAADGTELKTNIGGNACTAASFALAESAARLEEIELFQYFARQYWGAENVPKKFKLPTPFFNILNGGKHAGGHLKLQEFMASPKPGIPFPDQLRMVAEVYKKLGSILVAEKGVSAKNLGDEGGYAPLLDSPEEAITLIERAMAESGYKPGVDMFLGLDAAASEFYDSESKLYEVEVGKKLTAEQMIDYWADMVTRHPSIISIEDGLDEKDYENWTKLNEKIGDKIQLVGDDLYTTNPKTIARGLEGKWCNALLLKVNQIGTISEAMQAAKLVLDANQRVMVSHRSGETCNSVIADLSVAIGAQSIKTGSTARGERIQKYTRLLQIYDYLKEHDMLEE